MENTNANVTDINMDFDASQLASVKEIFKSYNKLTELCFMDCATDFTVGDLKSEEVRCAENCTSKFLKASERMTQRFQEYQLIMNEHVITAQQNANA
ncbi:PREDICTED: mitochondrial import inner membrane translocase subunit Tim9-like [Diuraphis noxia]|uniref:mitochondrial import inner membrane translocase subunit Tim9-like n=1 Tax=Diuraphis noxia TaxID=143948 RepID=UPI000763888D|nr:PREDICTED: mitochondrial import inner membrane translocase subunit Tim9-like [Diuraphis noxia]XP_015378955.1 PREDICTED: mitochondrial import inner membrane translocase subunit Tim9-like [Diuraphis noxia]